MIVIGLTGGIASGKSTVASELKQFNIPVCDTDVLARLVVEVGTSGLQALIDTFGRDILDDKGTLNRSALAMLIFSNAQARETVNRLLHPLIFKAIEEWLTKQTCQVAVIDMPLLFEVGYEQKVDQVIVVNTSQQIQIERLMARNHITRSQALQRIQSQMPLHEKMIKADYVIDNNGTREQTKAQVQRIVNTILEKTR